MKKKGQQHRQVATNVKALGIGLGTVLLFLPTPTPSILQHLMSMLKPLLARPGQQLFPHRGRLKQRKYGGTGEGFYLPLYFKHFILGKPKSLSGINFLKILAEDEMAFDILYCVAFEMIDAQWLAMRASYMEFNEVLKAARAQLERELCLEDVNQIQDLPAYNLLYQ
eukprot:Gb_03673 [translate_table: standard]